MRRKRLGLNTVTSLADQIAATVCGFILPRLILLTYGSEVNGLIHSITRFLELTAFLELGMGAVVRSSLYKPLAEGDSVSVSKIVASARRFFRRLAVIFFVYAAVLTAGYPFLAGREFGRLYTALMVGAVSISSFAQYYFGMADSLLLQADQRGYIQYTVQLAAIILNTAACAALIRLGAGVHAVKLAAALLYLLRPLALRAYVAKHYRLDRNIKWEGEPIRQKRDGAAQHIAAVVLDGTDHIVLTLFSTLSNVSVYSVCHLVVYGVKGLLMSLTNGLRPLLGELWARQELDTLNRTFGWLEWLVHTGTVFVFGCTGVLILPFISVYTAGVTDANYAQPLFAALLTAAHAGHCLRLPYSMMILAGGHFKQTRRHYVAAAAINVVLSVVLVRSFGLVGVAAGTLAAMAYQTVWMAYYVSKNLVKWPFRSFLKQIAVDGISAAAAAAAAGGAAMPCVSYASWAVMAVRTALIWLAVMIPVNLIFYRGYMSKLADTVGKLLMKK